MTDAGEAPRAFVERLGGAGRALPRRGAIGVVPEADGILSFATILA